jgi:hypothetical protein
VTEVYSLGGRRFIAADLSRRTVRQHHYLAGITREVGSPKRMPREDEEPLAFLVDWNAEVLGSGQACRLLAAFLLPDGATERDWTADMARDTQQFLEGLDTEADRELVDQLVMEALIGFFRNALKPLLISLKSSGNAEPSADERNEAA